MIRRIRLKINPWLWRKIGPTVGTLFHKYVYIHKLHETWKDTHWLGVPVQKIPFDLWVQQEILWECKPDLLVETGTYDGGSTLYYAHLFDIIGHGQIVSIDIEPQENLPQHPRITYIKAGSTDPDVIERLTQMVKDKTVMVILDSDHSEVHVRKELELYAPLVTPGQYLIVEDTNVNGHPVFVEHGPGPMEALDDWLKTKPPFDPDPKREKYVVSFHPRGYWRRRP